MEIGMINFLNDIIGHCADQRNLLYNPQSAGINMQSPKSATTLRRLTLGWFLNLPILPGDADWRDAVMVVFVAISLLISYKLFSTAVAIFEIAFVKVSLNN